MTAGGGISGYWTSDVESGVFRCGAQPQPVYTTLYGTKKLSKKGAWYKKRGLTPPESEMMNMDNDWCA